MSTLLIIGACIASFVAGRILRLVHKADAPLEPEPIESVRKQLRIARAALNWIDQGGFGPDLSKRAGLALNEMDHVAELEKAKRA